MPTGPLSRSFGPRLPLRSFCLSAGHGSGPGPGRPGRRRTRWRPVASIPGGWWAVVAGTAVVYALTSYLLGKTWYTKRVPFDDNSEWLQMDKVGPSFPRWLNLDLGYSGSGSTGGHTNPPLSGTDGRPVVFRRVRQFYLAPDAGFTRLVPANSTGRMPLRAAQFLKLPAPSLGFNARDGLRWHPLLPATDQHSSHLIINYFRVK